MKKRIVALMLTAAMCAGLLAGCGKSSDTAATGGDAPEEGSVSSARTDDSGKVDGVMYKEGLPLVDEGTYSFSIFCDGSNETDEFYMLDEFKKQTNVDVELRMFPNETATERLNLDLNSGDYADVVGGWILNDSMILTYGINQGVFIPLEDYFAEYCPKITEILDLPGVREEMTAPDGHIYTIPYVCDDTTVGYSPYINSDWLENVGMEIPTTTEEFEAVLKAFKEQDANGNGDPNDEIPLSVPDGMSYLRNYLPYFGYNLDSDTWLAIQDGKLVYIPTEEGYKEFLRYFTDLYKEGLLDPASFTQNYDQIAAMGSSGDVLGCFSALASFQFAGRDQDEEYQTLTPFAGQVYPQSTGIMHGSMMITDACDDPATLVAWADQLFTQEGGELYWLGVEGNSYVDNGDGTWSWNIGGPIGDDIATIREKGTLKYQTAFPGIQPDFWFTGITDPDESYLITQRAKMLDYGELTLPAMTYTTEETETIASLKADLDSYINQYGAQVITGAIDLDDSWDDYVSTMNTMGASELFEIYQNAFSNAK